MLVSGSRRFLSCLVLLGGLLSPAPAFANGDPQPPVVKKEEQSVFQFEDKKTLSSSALIKKLNEKLDGQYQDLELVFQACSSGEFATRATDLKGENWSVSTSTDTKCNSQSRKATQMFDGVEGLKVGDEFWHGYMAQHIKKMITDKDSGNKALHDFAEQNRHSKKKWNKGDPQYAFKGKGDVMTVRGDAETESTHAIVGIGFKKPKEKKLILPLHGALTNALEGAGYKDETVAYLASETSKDALKSDGTFTEAAFDKALDDLRVELDKNAKKEKAYIFIWTHGGVEQRVVAFKSDGDEGPGSGYVVDGDGPPIEITIDSEDVLVALQEELVTAGGYWANDPLLRRFGSPYIAFTTVEETFSASSLVNVFLGGHSIGSLLMGNPEGSDYSLDFTDSILDLLMPQIALGGAVPLSFDLPTAGDHFTLAVEADWFARPDVVDYGVRIGRPVATSVIPVPWSAPLLAGAVLLLGFGRRGCGPRLHIASGRM